ncbi:cation:proton antiporter domain-containing protein [Candidatus Nucleicultrix amoebiphila]|uniref:cation:proton antiporter domain-containing protein n=1 Tax=Candidatus Nucleicultrix amoebiphila TaxID=1509244 RepID=UPI0012F4C40E|nr:cation:proton antiporter [Candidatus Nucleicultrix amoebiphila]
MHETHYMSDTLILLITAAIVVPLFRRLKASPILGYLIGGLIIGPKALGFIAGFDGLKFFSQFGIVFLLFTIGLKMPLQRFQVLKRYVFGLGFAQVMLTTLAFSAICWWLDLSIEATILIGSALALSSTAVVLQLLAERGEIAQRFGRVAFAVLLLQDLFVVVLLVLMSTFAQSESSILSVLGISAVKAFLVLFMILMVGRLLLRPLYRAFVRINNQELMLILTLLVVLTTSVATWAAGLSMELGAFLAGLLLSETEYRHQVEADIHPFYGLLLGLFFMTVGMSINISLMYSQFSVILTLIVGMMAIKAAILFFLCLLFKLPRITAVRVGLLLAGGGEFVFVLFIPALNLEIITPEIAQLIYSAVAVSMALTPLLAVIGKRLDERWHQQESDASLHAALDEIGDLKNHVIIAGFGRVGKMVARLLLERMIPFVAIDNNMDNVSNGRAKGFPVFYGDASRAEVLRVLGVEKAKAAVVSINNTRATLKIATMIRRQFPHLQVSVRMRDDEYEAKLAQLGVAVIMPENLEPSLQLASAVLKAVGTPQEEVGQIIDNFRRAYSSQNAEDESK